MLTNKNQIRLVSLTLATLLALPVPLGIFTGLYIWTSPYILLNSIIAQKSVVLFNLIGLIFLTMIIYKDRFYCQYICPAGIVCDAVSKFAEKKIKTRKFPSVSKSLLVISILLSIFGIPVLILLDPVNAFNAFFDAVHSGISTGTLLKTSGLLFILLINLFFPHAWCRKICPLGGLQFIITDIKQLFKRSGRSRKVTFSQTRRYLISGILGMGSGLLLPNILKAGHQPMLRPPGILPDNDLMLTCTRCGNCLKACPTNIIQPMTGFSNWMNILTPCISFSESYCLPECTHCGEVCPTGAIQKFTVQEKEQLFIGFADLKPEECLLTKNQECDRCLFYCDFDAIEIVPSLQYNALPEINKETCVGCGACEVVCPARAIVIEPIN